MSPGRGSILLDRVVSRGPALPGPLLVLADLRVLQHPAHERGDLRLVEPGVRGGIPAGTGGENGRLPDVLVFHVLPRMRAARSRGAQMRPIIGRAARAALQ